jgi:hypothetical protein
MRTSLPNRATSFLAILVLLVAMVATAAAADHGKSAKEALEIVVQEVLEGQTEGVWVYATRTPLEAGTVVRGWDSEYIVPTRSWFFFIDDLPGANWHHPCRYVLVDCATGDITVIKEKNPPHFFADMEWVIGKPTETPTTPSGPTICPPHKKASPEQAEHLWAVLCAGFLSSWDYRYWHDISHQYTCLVEVYGYLDDHIYVLLDSGSHPLGEDLDDDGDSDSLYACTQANMDYVLGHLADILTSEDQFFMFVTDHGGSNGGYNVYMNLYPEGGYTPEELDYWMDRMDATNKMFCMEQCYSGGFGPVLMTTSGDNRVLGAACRYDEYSWKCDTEGDFDEFCYYWTSAVRWCYPKSSSEPWECGNPCDADANHDGRISMREAFDWADSHDSRDETPQYYESSAGIGDLMWLGPSEVELLSVELVPDNTIVPRGGTLGLTITVTNNTSQNQDFVAWTEVHPYGKNPVAGPKYVILGPQESVSKHISHRIPGSAPLRTYTYEGKAGTYPDDVWAEDSFEFTVVAGNGATGGEEPWFIVDGGL